MSQNTPQKTTADPDPFFHAVTEFCKKIRSMSKEHVTVESLNNVYVIPGRTITLVTPKGRYPIWVGRNQHRLFFIVNIDYPGIQDARDKFEFCFGGAQQAGWKVNYQSYNEHTSIWATVDTEIAKTFADEGGETTTHDMFWAADIAMMAQSFLRTAEREGIPCIAELPAPL